MHCAAELLRAVAIMVGLVPRRIVPKLRHFHWLLKMINQLFSILFIR